MFYSTKNSKNIFESNKNSPSYIRILNASPKAPALDVWINGEIINNLAFTNISNYITLSKGICDIKVFSTGTNQDPILDTKLTLPSNSKLTATISGIFPEIKLLPVSETFTSSNTEGVNVRFVHLSPDLPSVDVYMNEKEVFGNIKFEDFTEYYNIPSGEYSLEVRSINSNNSLLALEHIIFEEGMHKTIYSIGLMKDEPTLNVSVVQDYSENYICNANNTEIEEDFDEIITSSKTYSENSSKILSRFFRSNDSLVKELDKYGLDINLSEYLVKTIAEYINENSKRYTGDTLLKSNHAVYDIKLMHPWLFDTFIAFDIIPTRVDELVRNIAFFTLENMQ